MILLMAEKESPAWVFCNEFDLCCAFCRYENNIFVQAVHLGTSVYLSHLKGVPVQMNGVVVGAQIFHDQTVSHSSLEDWLVGVGIGFSINSPKFFISVSLELGVEDQFDRQAVI